MYAERGRSEDRPLRSVPREALFAAAGGCAAHALGDDADLFDARALGGVDDHHDVAVAQVAGAGDEHRLVLAFLEDRPQTAFELPPRHRLLVDGDLLVE